MVLNRVLDTNVILYLLGGKLSDPLPPGHYHASVITEMELLSYPSLTESEEEAVLNFLGDIHVVDISPDVKDHAIRLRRAHGLKLPDAIIAATALSLDAVLMTNDHGLIRVPGVQCQTVPLKVG